ncbi:MAG: DUF1427 family protein [Caulobacteraceae bacterium]|jgi:XapX domain-containing protein
MKAYILSLAAGLFIGVVYSIINVRSPAPPLVALVGLLGILGGEQIVPAARHLLAGKPAATAVSQTRANIFGQPPGRRGLAKPANEEKS